MCDTEVMFLHLRVHMKRNSMAFGSGDVVILRGTSALMKVGSIVHLAGVAEGQILLDYRLVMVFWFPVRQIVGLWWAPSVWICRHGWPLCASAGEAVGVTEFGADKKSNVKSCAGSL